MTQTQGKADFINISEIKAANVALGHTWFDRSNMRFFGTRVLRGVIDGRFFITSERMSMDTDRCYTIREAHADGAIFTVGEFQGHATADAARKAARALA